jgi:uncharacterized membrane protein YcaP (DUF421 family)
METALRVAFIYFFLMAAMRLMGKREFSQLSPMEFVSLLLIPEIVSQSLVRDDYSITTAIIGVSTLLMLVFFTTVIVQFSPRAEKIIQGSPTILAESGKLMVENMNRERVTADELDSEIKLAGLEELKQVKWAILQSDGKIAIIPVDPQDIDKRPPEREEMIG